MANHIMPTMRYRDARHMISWLNEAFGFEARMVVDGPGDLVMHAQLSLGRAMIMLGSVREDELGNHQVAASLDAPVTQSAYIVTDEVDPLAQRAVNAGAVIVTAPEDAAQGGRFFSCRDPEGQLWNFGSYDPWKDET